MPRRAAARMDRVCRRRGRDRPCRRRLRFRQRDPAPSAISQSLRPGEPTGQQRRIRGVHRRRGLSPARALVVRRLGLAAREPDRGAAVLGRRRRMANLHPARHAAARGRRTGLPCQPVRGRCLRALGGREAADRSRVGSCCRRRSGRRPLCRKWRVAPASCRAQRAAPAQLFGDVWEWTRSAYAPYPGYHPAAGAIGEYNGKFMCNQYVLRGGSCATPRAHVRATYRNFFPASARWQFSGFRLARDAP